jgi:hypothetical protein
MKDAWLSILSAVIAFASAGIAVYTQRHTRLESKRRSVVAETRLIDGTVDAKNPKLVPPTELAKSLSKSLSGIYRVRVMNRSDKT